MFNDVEKTEILITAARLLSSKLDIADLLTTIMKLATVVVNCERASLYLLDEKTQELYFHVALDLDDDIKKMRLKLGEGIAGLCAKEGKSIISNSIENDERHTKKIDEKSGYITKSLLTCPMIIKGKVIGVVQAINKIDGEFDEIDKNNFEAFASQAAIAIENSRLFNSLKHEKSKLETLLEVIEEGIIVTDNKGFVKMRNSSSFKYFGASNLKYLNISDIISDFVTEKKIEDVLSEKKSCSFIVKREKPKRLVLRCKFIPKIFVNDIQQEEEFVWIFNDVTKEFMEAKISREFLSLISHKVKTPLTSIVGFSQLLKEDTHLCNDKIKKAVDNIVKSGFKLNDIFDKILSYTAIENKTRNDLVLNSFRIDELVKKVVDDFKKKEQEVIFELNFIDVFYIDVDSSLFDLALKEIISNSIKFNLKDEKRIIITSKLDLNKRILLIWDNGNGIPPEEVDKVFDKFYQVEDSFTGQVEGVGLGLALVRKVVDLHSFDIEIRSKIDNYTLVKIVFDK